MARVQEIIYGVRNLFRVNTGYYPAALTLQQVTDADFKRSMPAEFLGVMHKIGEANNRWDITEGFFNNVVSTLQQNKLTGYIGDYSAKSAFSTWFKAEAKGLDYDEVFDLYRMRFVSLDPSHARSMISLLTANYSLMQPHGFRYRPHDMHSPIRGSLDKPNSRGYASVRLNLEAEGNIFEVEVMTRKAYGQRYSYLQRKYQQKGGGRDNILGALESEDYHKDY